MENQYFSHPLNGTDFGYLNIIGQYFVFVCGLSPSAMPKTVDLFWCTEIIKDCDYTSSIQNKGTIVSGRSLQRSSLSVLNRRILNWMRCLASIGVPLIWNDKLLKCPVLENRLNLTIVSSELCRRIIDILFWSVYK